jgi:hypothetical protein
MVCLKHLRSACSTRERTAAEAAEAAAQRGLQLQRDLDIRAAITAFEVRSAAIHCTICAGQGFMGLWVARHVHVTLATCKRGPPYGRCTPTNECMVLSVQEANQLLPGNALYLSLLSKQWSDITFIPSTPKAEAKSCAERGLAIAEEVHFGAHGRAAESDGICCIAVAAVQCGFLILEHDAFLAAGTVYPPAVAHHLQAVAADPSCCMAHIAACVAKGRLTFFVDNRRKVVPRGHIADPGSWQGHAVATLTADSATGCQQHYGSQVELAAGAAEDTQAALAADPENDLAHHLLGRWHTEMAQVCTKVPMLPTVCNTGTVCM